MIRRPLVVLVAARTVGRLRRRQKPRRRQRRRPRSSPHTTAPPPMFVDRSAATDLPVLKRPALVVKIDNADGSSPANVARLRSVSTKPTWVRRDGRGSVTRLAAVFHSSESTAVGRIRSFARPIFAVFTPLHNPLFAWSGANDDFRAILQDSAHVDVGMDARSEVYVRRGPLEPRTTCTRRRRSCSPSPRRCGAAAVVVRVPQAGRGGVDVCAGRSGRSTSSRRGRCWQRARSMVLERVEGRVQPRSEGTPHVDENDASR